MSQIIFVNSTLNHFILEFNNTNKILLNLDNYWGSTKTKI